MLYSIQSGTFPKDIVSPQISTELQEFITSLLRNDPAERPTARQLLSSPFIQRGVDMKILPPHAWPLLENPRKLTCTQDEIEVVVEAALGWSLEIENHTLSQFFRRVGHPPALKQQTHAAAIARGGGGKEPPEISPPPPPAATAAAALLETRTSLLIFSPSKIMWLAEQLNCDYLLLQEQFDKKVKILEAILIEANLMPPMSPLLDALDPSADASEEKELTLSTPLSSFTAYLPRHAVTAEAAASGAKSEGNAEVEAGFEGVGVGEKEKGGAGEKEKHDEPVADVK